MISTKFLAVASFCALAVGVQARGTHSWRRSLSYHRFLTLLAEFSGLRPVSPCSSLESVVQTFTPTVTRIVTDFTTVTQPPSVTPFKLKRQEETDTDTETDTTTDGDGDTSTDSDTSTDGETSTDAGGVVTVTETVGGPLVITTTTSTVTRPTSTSRVTTAITTPRTRTITSTTTLTTTRTRTVLTTVGESTVTLSNRAARTALAY